MANHRTQDLLVEVIRAPVTILAEGKDGDGRMHIKAKLLEADLKNRNGRVYPLAIVQREVGKLQERIQAGIAFGSGGHPADGVTDFNNISHAWTKVWLEGPSMFGEATVLNAGRGQVLQEVIRVTNSIPVSVRGFGTVAPAQFNGEHVDLVQDSYQLVTADVVLSEQGFDDAKVLAIKEDTAPKGEPPMDIKELKEKHPDLVKALTDEVSEQVAKKVTADLTKAFEEKILSRLAEEKDQIREAVKAEVLAELQVGEMKQVLEQIATAAAPFAGSPAGNAKAEAGDAALKKEAERLTAELNKVGQGLKEAQDARVKAEAALEAAMVPAYLAEKVKLERGAPVLVEALKDAKTRKEVDERLPTEKAKLVEILKLAPALAGTGKVQPEGADGTLLTEQQQRDQRLAGIAS